MIGLAELVRYLDDYLRVREIPDSSKNGLQVEGPEMVGRVAVATDSSVATFEAAVALRADLLIVHHGLFWGREQPLVGAHYRRVKTLIDGGVALYAAHLPLDAHDEVGNNIELARLLGLQVDGPFGQADGADIGWHGRLPTPTALEEVAARLSVGLDSRVVIQAHGKPVVETVAVVSGGAAGFIGQAARQGMDLFITGETSQIHAHDAAENGINAIYAGHYATETLGVKALARHLAERFGVGWTFIDRPTGM